MGAKTLLRHLGLSKSWKIHHMQYISLHWNESCQLLPILPLMALFKWKSVGKINSSQFYTYNTTVSNQDRVPALMLSCLGQSNKSFRPLSDDLTTSGRLSSTCKVLLHTYPGGGRYRPDFGKLWSKASPGGQFLFHTCPPSLPRLPPTVRTDYKKTYLGINTSSIGKKLTSWDQFLLGIPMASL